MRADSTERTLGWTGSVAATSFGPQQGSGWESRLLSPASRSSQSQISPCQATPRHVLPVERNPMNARPQPSVSAPNRSSVSSRVGHSRRRRTVLFSLMLSTLVLAMLFMAVAGIDCFKCVSLNGNNPSCEDPFHNNYSSSILEAPCMGGRKGRNGLFPATACIKLTGTYYDNKSTVVVRGCALDSGTLTADTEIIRMSHCGDFKLDDRYVKGCLQSCDDADGCNAAARPNYSLPLLSLVVLHVFQILVFHHLPFTNV